jgi:hypothetical protein
MSFSNPFFDLVLQSFARGAPVGSRALAGLTNMSGFDNLEVINYVLCP